MGNDRAGGMRPGRRAFRPTVDGRLEERALLSTMGPIKVQTAAGGQAVVVTNTDGQKFFVSIINGGTVRAFAASGGRVNLVVDGSTVDSLLQINQVIPTQGKNSAHTFNTAAQTQYGLLNVASITVTSGTIGAIEGYRDTILSGSVTIGGPNRVDRLAFASIVPGASIGVGGDLNTLDVLNDATFSTSPGLFVGRDLNSFSVGGNLAFSNGANFQVVRDVGLTPQSAKGSGPAGQGIVVYGNLSVAPESGFSIGRYLDGGLIVNGNVSGASKIIITYYNLGTYLSFGFSNILIKGTISP